FVPTVDGIIAEHLALETNARPVLLAEYARPTARAFGYLFRCMSRLPGLAEQAELLERMGECVGSAIIAYDCAVDRDRDRRRGEFNPLPEGAEAIQSALSFSRDALIPARPVADPTLGTPPLAPGLSGDLTPLAPLPPVSSDGGKKWFSFCDCCDGFTCCCEGSSCALDSSCDSLGSCGSCDGCGGCDCS